LVRDLQGVTYEIIIVTGHADRIGTESYNQALSERRAAAVRNYLVAANVSAQTIRSEGRGESQPITTPAQCQGRSGDALKACYQPDRRVEVEVSGERPAR
jgi:OOP family OmpA-OmpF porin